MSKIFSEHRSIVYASTGAPLHHHRRFETVTTLPFSLPDDNLVEILSFEPFTASAPEEGDFIGQVFVVLPPVNPLIAFEPSDEQYESLAIEYNLDIAVTVDDFVDYIGNEEAELLEEMWKQHRDKLINDKHSN